MVVGGGISFFGARPGGGLARSAFYEREARVLIFIFPHAEGNSPLANNNETRGEFGNDGGRNEDKDHRQD